MITEGTVFRILKNLGFAIVVVCGFMAGYLISFTIQTVGNRSDPHQPQQPKQTELDLYLAQKAKCEAAGGEIKTRGIGRSFVMRTTCEIDGASLGMD